MYSLENIKNNWKTVTASDVMDVRDGTHDTPRYLTRGIPLITSKNLKDNNISFEKVSFISDKDHEEISKRSQVEEGDILFAMIGTIGNPVIIKGKAKFSIKNIGLFKKNEKLVLPKFFLNFLKSNIFKKQISEAKLLKGTTQAFIPLGNLRKIQFPLPSLPEQQAIVAKMDELFSELDKGVEQLQTAQQQLKIYRQSLLKAAFEGRLTYTVMKDGELSKGWKRSTIKEVCENIKVGIVIKPTAFYSSNNNGIRAFRSANVREFSINDSNWVYFTSEANEINKRTQINEGDVLIVRSGYPGTSCVVTKEFSKSNAIDILIATPNRKLILPEYLCAFNNSSLGKRLFSKSSRGVAQKHLNVGEYSKLEISYPDIQEQNKIMEVLEQKLSVCNKKEEIINNALLQAEILRQSILKQAFEGKLVNVEKQDAKVIHIYKPKNEYFYQLQVLGLIAKASKQNNVPHGEMTLAKYAYLTDKLFDVPTFYDYQRWHLGPFPPIIKKVFNNKQYFKKVSGELEILNEKKLFKTANPHQQQIESAVAELTNIFSKYEGKERAHKTELLATVCKVIEDIQTVDLKAVRASMADWKIELRGEKHKTKAEKFTEAETKKCLAFLKEKRWDKKLLNSKSE